MERKVDEEQERVGGATQVGGGPTCSGLWAPGPGVHLLSPGVKLRPVMLYWGVFLL